MRDDIDRATLLERLLDPAGDAATIASSLGISLEQFATIMQDASVRRTLDGLVDIHEARTRILLSQLRMNAVIGLARLAANEDGGESVRKACVDLLTMALPGQPDVKDTHADVWTTDTLPALHELLEVIGARSA